MFQVVWSLARLPGSGEAGETGEAVGISLVGSGFNFLMEMGMGN